MEELSRGLLKQNKMGKLLVKDKDIVVPGEVLAEGMDFLPNEGAFREGDKLLSMRLGLVSISGRLIKVINLSGRYIPKAGDTVIGEVTDIGFNGWRVDIGWAFDASISMKDGSRDYIERGADLTHYYTYGDLIVGKITNVVGSKIIDITMNGPNLRKLRGGRVIECAPSKVPRIIGKQGSMIRMINEATSCNIIVGQNGRVWIFNQDNNMELIAVRAIRMIEQKAHLSGLTDEVKEFLENETNKKKR